MHLREMNREDIFDVGLIGVRAYEYDEVFNWLMPNAASVPDVYRQRQVLRAKQRMAEFGCVCIVAETEPSDPMYSGKPEIMGYAFWIRKGGGKDAKKWQDDRDSFSNKIERTLLDIQFLYELKVFDRGATNMKRAGKFMQAMDFRYELEPGYWYFGNLAVDNKFRRQGVGEKLTRWGMERAAEEGIPCTLEASKMAEPLYTRLGWVVGERRDCEGVVEGVWMYWEPEKLKGKWVAAIEEEKQKQSWKGKSK